MYNFRDRAFIIGSLLTLDLLAISLTLLAAYWLTFGGGLPSDAPQAQPIYYLGASLFLMLVTPIIFAGRRLYDSAFVLAGWDEYKQVVNGTLLAGMLAILALVVADRSAPLSRIWILTVLVGSMGLIGVARFLFRRVIRAIRRRGHAFVNRVIIVGANTQGAAIARQWSRSTELQVIGFADDFLPLGAPVIEGVPVLGPTTALVEIIAQHNVQEIVVVPNGVAWETFEEVLDLARTRDDLLIRFSPGYYELLATGVTAIQRGFVPLLSIEKTRITGTDGAVKAAIDYSLALPLALISLPLMALISVGLALSGPSKGGPILERYRLIGLGGREFTTHKFRTGIPPHPRTRRYSPPNQQVISRFRQAPWLHQMIYRASLDKLPQLWSVLRGHMSLVGPHPISASAGDLPLAFASRRNLQTVKPGLTGPWVVGNAPNFEEEVRQDLYYVRNWTIWLDLQILVETAILILKLRAPNAEPLSTSEPTHDPYP